MTSDQTLRAAFAALSLEARPAQNCPTAEELFIAANGSAARKRFEEIVEHTVGCGACAESWRLARELNAGLEQAAAPGRSWTRGWLLLPLAAAILLAVGLPLMRQWSGDSSAPVWRAGGQREITSLQPEDKPLPRDQFMLRWSEPAPGARYRVDVGGERLEPIATGDELVRPEFQVPAAALASLPDGAKILWRVQARLPDGRVVLSPTFVARLQ